MAAWWHFHDKPSALGGFLGCREDQRARLPQLVTASNHLPKVGFTPLELNMRFCPCTMPWLYMHHDAMQAWWLNIMLVLQYRVNIGWAIAYVCSPRSCFAWTRPIRWTPYTWLPTWHRTRWCVAILSSHFCSTSPHTPIYWWLPHAGTPRCGSYGARTRASKPHISIKWDIEQIYKQEMNADILTFDISVFFHTTRQS